ncbi:Microcystin dependent protein [Lysobacter capsici AZ78]|uniref:Microcystin dependent protein n=1 Tax=Lysobacter capsici AZ78 TaxID=1444315 RepID=A0A125U0A6_9GAMM|nr:tail fiber protein [Lysobacter capsici]KWS02541.1 Microcystin dependent protein [Lysobacter capsici AZ78]WND78445.1 tail fiber protein [Lysobacter capsici]WND83640.1 tail fiber protein [Lysobacter capsici]
MTEVFLGQIMTVGFGFAPKGFALCNGQLLPIAQNQALFSLLGTMYGGNGTTTFALPNMQSRTPVGAGQGGGGWSPSPYQYGETGGVENVTLLPPQLPAHNHNLCGVNTATNARNPTSNFYGTTSTAIYANTGQAQVALSPATIGQTGNTTPHPNLQPYCALNFVIATQGIYPSRN